MITEKKQFSYGTCLKLLKVSEILKTKRITIEVNSKLIEKLTPNNACIYYKIFKLYYSKYAQICVLKYIERWFSTIVKYSKHITLSFDLVKEIFSSSELNITSEVEVFNAADNWLKHDFDKRCKFAFDLIKMIRLPLLTFSTLNKMLHVSSFSRCSESRKYLNIAMSNTVNKHTDQTSTDCQIRYCSQQHFNLVVCGMRKKKPNSNMLYSLHGKYFGRASEVVKMI